MGPDAAPDDEKGIPFKQKYDCLGREVTQQVFAFFTAFFVELLLLFFFFLLLLLLMLVTIVVVVLVILVVELVAVLIRNSIFDSVFIYF